MYYAVQSIHFNDRAPSLFWLSKSTAITTEYNFTHTHTFEFMIKFRPRLVASIAGFVGYFNT